MYTAFLVIFSSFSLQANQNTVSFEASKPDIVIINDDDEVGLTKSLTDYLRANSIEKEYVSEEIPDALFYRSINIVIHIPKNFRIDFLEGKNPKIEIQSTGDYQASLANMLLKRYLKIANTYRSIMDNEEDIISSTERTLSEQVAVKMTTKLDTGGLEKASRYFNFMNYCLLAGAIFIICLVMAIFKDKKIEKRTIISSTDYGKFNRQLLLCNALFTVALWFIYVFISLFLVGHAMFSVHGLLYMLNSLIFSFCALSLAFLLSTVVRHKEAINGIVNVIALGSSFLCGAFVPVEFLPKSVLNAAHVLPSYWFIQSNERIKTLETFDWINLRPIMTNIIVICGFTLLFIAASILVAKLKRKKD